MNISKLAKELNKDRKTIKKYLEGKVPYVTRVRVKYLDKYRSFDYIDHLYNYLVKENQIKCNRSTLKRYIWNDEEINSLFNKKECTKILWKIWDKTRSTSTVWFKIKGENNI